MRPGALLPPAPAAARVVHLPPAGTWRDYLRPFRFDHWIKNLVVPVGSLLALAAARTPPAAALIEPIVLAFVLSGLVSSINYAVNEILDAPFDARHPAKRIRPIPSGRVRVRPLLLLTGLVTVATFAGAVWLFPPPFVLAAGALFVAALVYNLPPARLKDWPYLDVVTESLTNPIRIAIGWHAVAAPGAPGPPALLLLAVWIFGAFLMTGKRLAELRRLGDQAAARYRPTFRAYSVRALFVVQLGYALLGLVFLTALVAGDRPRVLPALPLVAGLLVWAFRMTFEPDSPLVDPERLYRRPVFLLIACATFVLLVVLAMG